MDLYELIIDDSEDLGVDFIALVETPAIKSNWIAFNKQEVKQQFKIQDEEKRLVSGYLMKADLPIIRITASGESFHVVFKKDTIFKIVCKYMENGFNANVNLNHEKETLADGVFLIESRIIDDKRHSFAPEGFEDAPNGSWWGTMYVRNEKIWQEIKKGVFKGFSVEGNFLQSRNPIDPNKEAVEKIEQLIKDFEKSYPQKS